MSDTQRLQAERMAAMAKLAAGVAHEVNNPVGVLMMKLKFLLSVAEAEGLSERAVATLGVAVEQTERIERIVGRLVRFSRPTQGVPRRLRLDDELARLVEAQRRRFAGAPLQLRWQAGVDVPDIEADPAELERIVEHLVSNAVDAVEARGTIVVSSAAVVEAGRRWAQVTVQDDGPGIPEDFIERIYDPFFSTKKTGEAAGLGLAVVYGLVRLRGGTVTAHSRRGSGTTMTVRLPAVFS